ncbi:hypothetical protein RJZ56_003010 [Blastomyces dermatitidis]
MRGAPSMMIISTVRKSDNTKPNIFMGFEGTSKNIKLMKVFPNVEESISGRTESKRVRSARLALDLFHTSRAALRPLTFKATVADKLAIK